jgi:hypothetical protein
VNDLNQLRENLYVPLPVQCTWELDPVLRVLQMTPCTHAPGHTVDPASCHGVRRKASANDGGTSLIDSNLKA